MRSSWQPYFGPYFDASTDTGGGFSNIRDAFRAAVEQHQGGGTAAGEESIGEDDEGDDEGAGEDDAADDPDEAEGRGTERTRGKQTAKPAGADEGDETVEGDEDEPADTSALSSDKAFEALQKQHANDPAALRKALLGDYTKKTQALASSRKQYKEIRPFLEAYEEDPATAIRVLLQQSGVDPAKVLGTAGEQPGAGKTKTADEISAEMTEQVTAAVKESLGPELDYLADPIAAAIRKGFDLLVPGHIERTVKPLEARTQALADRDLGAQLDTTMKAFEAKYPDWKTYEKDMLALSREIAPAPGSTELKYMETLYKTASRDAWEADKEANIERAANGRFKKRLAKHNDAEPGDGTRGTPDDEVRSKAPKDVSFQAAYEAAKRGERWEDDD